MTSSRGFYQRRRRRRIKGQHADHVKRVCVSGKRGYPSRQYAEQQITLLNQSNRRDGRLERAYHCELCDAWHLTSLK